MLPACLCVTQSVWHKQLREESVVWRKNQLVCEANVNPVLYMCNHTVCVMWAGHDECLPPGGRERERESVLLMLFCGVSCYLSSLGTGVFSSCQPQRATCLNDLLEDVWRVTGRRKNIHHLKISLTDCGQDVMDAAEECHGTVDCFVCCKTCDR